VHNGFAAGPAQGGKEGRSQVGSLAALLRATIGVLLAVALRAGLAALEQPVEAQPTCTPLTSATLTAPSPAVGRVQLSWRSTDGCGAINGTIQAVYS